VGWSGWIAADSWRLVIDEAHRGHGLGLFMIEVADALANC
jgi:hypothetical protein